MVFDSLALTKDLAASRWHRHAVINDRVIKLLNLRPSKLLNGFDLDLENVLVLLVRQSLLLKVREEYEVWDQAKGEEDTVLHVLGAVVHHKQGGQRLETISETRSCAEDANELLWDGLDVSDNG